MSHVIAMPSTGSIIRTREFIYFHPPPTLYAARHCACHSCLALAGSNAAAEDQALLARQLCLAFACLLALSRGLSARVKASISLQPSIHPSIPSCPPAQSPPRHRLQPALPHQLPSIRHRRIATPTPATLRAKPCIPIRLKPRLPLQGVALHL